MSYIFILLYFKIFHTESSHFVTHKNKIEYDTFEQSTVHIFNFQFVGKPMQLTQHQKPVHVGVFVHALIAYEQKPPLNTHTDVSSRARGLNFSLSLGLHPYFVYASNEGSGESAHAQARLRLRARQCDKYQNSHVLAQIYVFD